LTAAPLLSAALAQGEWKKGVSAGLDRRNVAAAKGKLPKRYSPRPRCFMPTSLQSLGYLPVSTATLYIATVLDFDLYVQHAGRGFAELYRERRYPLTPDDLKRLHAGGVDHLYIRLQDKEAYGQYLRKHVLGDSGVPFSTRMRALREVTRVAFEDAL